MSFQEFVGKKHGMTQIFSEDGSVVPVTVVELLPMTVTQIKTMENDRYSAVQVGFQPSKEKHLTKAEQGHFKKHELPLLSRLREVRVSESELSTYKVGDSISEEGALTKGVLVDVTGHSRGMGFQGNTKRHGHHRGPMSHGSKSHRLPGSIGAGTTPGRVFKGTRMAGRMGNEQVTITNLKIAEFYPEQNLILLRGAVPGVEGGLVVLKLKRPQWNMK